MDDEDELSRILRQELGGSWSVRPNMEDDAPDDQLHARIYRIEEDS